MTYYSLVKAIQTACQNHKQVQSYGYGNLSNIETPLVYEDRRYPYVFLNPTTHTMQEGTILYRFNMIVMDLAGEDFRDVPNDEASIFTANIVIKSEDTILYAQSDCLLIINDILSELRYAIEDTDVTLNVGLTPFEERFNDTVAGMTATIEVVLPNTLNQCDSPIA